jgi:transcriptional regulator with XRE-family HTH domain
VNEISPTDLKAWMKTNKVTQMALAEMLGTSHTSVGRWLKGVHSISGPEQKLLAYLMFGELPFPIQSVAEGWSLDFTEAEFAVIRLCARREGFASAEDWIVAKIRAYLSMYQARSDEPSLRVASDETPYKVNVKKS